MSEDWSGGAHVADWYKIKPFHSTGLMGELDIEKKLLELPIPTFYHQKLESEIKQIDKLAIDLFA
jgi:hypothetical protein